MTSLEICTQKIFNNLIKQNQKVGSDSVLKQSTTESSVQRPASSVQRPASSVQRPVSRESPASKVQSPASKIQRPESSVESPAPRVQCPESSVQRPESSVQSSVSSFQSLTSNYCVQNPGILLCRIIISKSIKFEFCHMKLTSLKAEPRLNDVA